MLKSDSTKKVSSHFGRFGKDQDWVIIRWMLILRLAVVTTTLGAAILIIPKDMMDKTPIIVIVFGTYLLTILYWLAHHLSEIHRPLLATQIAFDIFIVTVIIHYTGETESSFVGFYLLSIMCASLFFRRLITFLFSTQAMVFYVLYILLYIYYFGPYSEISPIPDNVKYDLTLQTFLYIVVMVAVAFISSTFAERMTKKDTALLSALNLLKEAQLDTSDILQSMTNGLITVNMDGYIVYMNRAAEKVLQIKSGEAGGGLYNDVLSDRAHEMAEVIEYGLAEASGVFEKEINVFDKNIYPVPLGLTCAPLYGTDKSRRGIIINFKDLSEKNKLIEMIREADRMAAIGELSAAIAHEIRNPLASISNAAELLSECYDKNNLQISKLVNVIEKESERLQRVSTEFLGFARVKVPKIHKLNLKETIEDVLNLIENDPRYTKSISIRNNVEDNIYVVFDEDNLKQLIINILINSLDALEGTGEIVINIENNKQYEDKYVRLVIYDNGPGFPDEALGHMFEPFFSTKKEGSGLGLALVRKLIISNHGRVLARNKEGAGAEIALDIPLNGI